MKKLCFLFLIGFLGFNLASIAQTDAKFAKAVISGGDEETFAQWENNRHDFGNIPQGEPVTTTFLFTNLRSEPLLIDNVRTGCGCTAPSWTKEAVLPGEKSGIEISFNAHKEGKFNKVIKVFLHGQKEPEVLIIQGEVAKKVEAVSSEG